MCGHNFFQQMEFKENNFYVKKIGFLRGNKKIWYVKSWQTVNWSIEQHRMSKFLSATFLIQIKYSRLKLHHKINIVWYLNLYYVDKNIIYIKRVFATDRIIFQRKYYFLRKRDQCDYFFYFNWLFSWNENLSIFSSANQLSCFNDFLWCNKNLESIMIPNMGGNRKVKLDLDKSVIIVRRV